LTRSQQGGRVRNKGGSRKDIGNLLVRGKHLFL